jgi:hypothetical protein
MDYTHCTVSQNRATFMTAAVGTSSYGSSVGSDDSSVGMATGYGSHPVVTIGSYPGGEANWVWR